MNPAQIVRDMGPKKVTLYSSAITAAIAAILAVMHFGKIAEPYWIVTRGLMRESIAHQTVLVERMRTGNALRQSQLELAVLAGRRDSLRGAMFNLRLLLDQSPTTPVEYRNNIERQLQDMSDRLKVLDDRLKDLRTEIKEMEHKAARE